MKRFWKKTEQGTEMGRKVRQTAKTERVRLGMESLEDRMLLSGGCDIDFNKTTGVLTIEGSDYADVASVQVQGTKVVAELSCGNGSDDDKSVKASKVTKIVFQGLA